MANNATKPRPSTKSQSAAKGAVRTRTFTSRQAVQMVRETIEAAGLRAEVLDDGQDELAALRPSNALASSVEHLSLRDLIARAAWPSEAHGWEPDEAKARGETEWHPEPERLALEGIADELEVLALALEATPKQAKKIATRVIVRLQKRARVALALADRVAAAGEPRFEAEAESGAA